MIRRLQKKFILLAVLSVFTVLLVLIGAINIINYRNMVADADSTLQILAEHKGYFPIQYRTPPEDDGQSGAPFGRRNATPELPYQTRYFTAFFDGDGKLYHINMENIVSIDGTGAISLAQETFEAGKEKGFAGDYRFRRCSTETGTMLIFLNISREQATVHSFLLASIAISLAGLLAVLLLLILFSGRIVRPIAESYEKQKQFITDAGHELKTPITIINADADVLETELEDSEWLADIRKQTGRLTSLTSDLIYLSKMAEDGTGLMMTGFPLSDTVEETVQSFRAVAMSRNLSLSEEIQPGISMNGDEKSIGRLVSILLDNACKYTPEGGSISVSLEKSGRSIQLTVNNTTENIAQGSADMLFERFYRADSSRNSESGGFGLGLAVAKAVSEAHKGKIRAWSEDGASLKVRAEFPA
ncbi:MAG: HAMP domain-containing histidine kinase [Oscillospiraceae bacterium]|nr:HAMP domain-containing histidine kinase [Oscillospiraceae bacterium]